MRSYWKDAGCTIVADGWTDKRCRSFNFVVRSPAGTCFVKSVDSSGLTNDVDRLFKLFSEVIDWVGAENVVHVVTDNAANYDICALSHVSPVVQNASKVATFVYNHGPILYWLQRRETWKEIASPVATRFAATILTPRNVLEQQSDLEALAVSELFRDSAFSKTEAGKAVKSIIMDRKFWEDTLFIVRLTTPIVRFLRIVTDSDSKPALGYVYEGMLGVEKAIKAACDNVEADYKRYIDILKERWERHLNHDLIVAAYFFNPTLRYGLEFDHSTHVSNALSSILENPAFCPDASRAMEELTMYQDGQGWFGRKAAVHGLEVLPPSESDN
ncbi:hypothetical protein LINGRAHAP2_LOCUS21967 [Linum grandiflorum]